MRDTSARAAKRVSRTKHNRIPDLFSKFYAVFDILHDFGSRDRFSDFLHGFLEHFAVFGLLDGQCRSPEKLYAVRVKETGFRKLHAKVQACLSGTVRGSI